MGGNLLLEGLVVFAVIAVLQLPGKSNFGVITLSTRHPYRDVFIGASIGLGLATVVSVTLGYGAETVLGPYLPWVKAAGGVVLLAFGVREILRTPAPIHEPGEGTPAVARTAGQVRLVSLGLAFLLEMGDNTQILAIVFVASTGNVVLVFIAAASALVMITAISSRGARYLHQHVSEERLRVVLGGLLIAVGLLTILFTAVPSLLPFAG
ncbi:MAG: TMEM165/GDT1 family protein [Thermoplasmata archaeon]